MSLLGIWNWMKGNVQCRVCGSYDTKKTYTTTPSVQQRWETDWTMPVSKDHVMPQHVFDVVSTASIWKCEDCKNTTVGVDVQKRRA